MKKFYVTTPIYYVNAEPHIGSSYTTIVGDIISRYKRMRGFDVFYLTGTDEHGQKILQAARAKGISPQELCDELSGKFKTLWKDLKITNDYFVRTTDEQHMKTVQFFVKKMLENGDIYKGKYEGWYCVPCETYWTEDEIEEKDGKKVCPSCGREVNWVEEENYFFKLSKYNEPLKKHFEENPDFLEPEFRKNEMLKILESGLKDLSITRTTFNWGVPMPDDPKHVIYVWVDALINYVSALGYPENMEKFEKYWPADLHLIGKEINRFHSLIWPAMLMSVGLPLPKKIFAHGWLTVNGQKISKSLGNAIDPRILVEAYGNDVIRYYLLRDIVFGKDGDFSEDNLITRYNSDLVNDLSNLVHRTLSMVNKYFDGVIPEIGETEEVDNQLKDLINSTVEKYENYMDKYLFTNALESLWELVRFTNKYIDLTEPWLLGKDESKKSRLGTVMYNLMDSIRIIALLISPVMPDTALKILGKLGIENVEEYIKDENIKIGLLKSGVKVNIGEPVFKRIDVKKWEKVIKMKEEKKMEEKKTEVKEVKKEEEKTENVLIDINHFAQVDLRVAKILEAEKVKKSRKLVKLQLDLGELGKRQIVAGIANYYEPENLVGKKIIVVANLKPAKLMGIESNGMLLAAKIGDKLTLLTTDEDIEPGAKIS
ncbi:protein containing C-terminal region/beta chain of methionyl-tRNA synthetase [Marinitoga piezophila KA3]|uniref:Methionine--tRNA ligase n=1 Tax=Marinitoga piezophila (strain DSM 14283 / JCM 11233 / KA3) TaxID=443254 RepID=H2J6N8_MARPK|nr:methionine--tRNA ligase [Marinitoga piezophila]AEX86319.1 protein containing C-terminal region/beta chain of methionyl-tRNA synthetase [Marinitoga piezophila KA3]